jgi:hypothetical protein
MRRAAAISVAIVAATIALLGPTGTALSAPPCVPAERCCKICDTGQACGNSCISRNKQCHKGHGCACNASEVCSAQPQ